MESDKMKQMKIVRTVNTFVRKHRHCPKCSYDYSISPRVPKIKGYEKAGFSAIKYSKDKTKVKGEFYYRKVKRK
jgi:hypothetical protein